MAAAMAAFFLTCPVEALSSQEPVERVLSEDETTT